MKKCFMITLSLINVGIFLINVVSLSVFFSSGNIIVVNGDGGDDYTTIQAAVNDAQPGDTIVVKAATNPYNEAVTIDNTKNDIKLVGVGKIQSIIDGNGLGGVNGITLTNTSGILVKNFRVQNFDGYGIEMENSNNNSIIGNTISNQIGMDINISNNNVIIRNIVNDNIEGISLGPSDNNTIKGNIVNNNSDIGIFLYVDANNNNIFFNRAFGNGNFDIQDQDANNFKGNKCGTSSPAGLCN